MHRGLRGGGLLSLDLGEADVGEGCGPLDLLAGVEHLTGHKAGNPMEMKTDNGLEVIKSYNNLYNFTLLSK